MAQSDNMVLSESARKQRTAPIAVIDIGSNSIRLVIYASGGRYPFPLFNERSNCRLGEGLGADGLLQPERISVALAALSRFSGIMKSMNVSTIHAVATAAVRQAKNAIEFTGPAEAILGQPINVLSQLEEAHYVARGLTLNIPDATGLVADLGGGSLEVVALENGDVRHSTSFNFGHLSSVESEQVDSALAAVPWLNAGPKSRIYGVGGSFRALGLAYIEQTGYALSVLHGLRIPGGDAVNMLSAFSRDNPDLSGVPLGRQKTMPTAATIMEALIRRSAAERIIVSGTSIRDGLIADRELGAGDRADFLQVVCQEISRTSHRFAGVPEALMALLRPLFTAREDRDADMVAQDRQKFERLLEAACYLSDMCWNEHEDVRGGLGARRVLGLPVNCITHKERVWLAVAIYHRYVGRKTNKSRPHELSFILSRRRRAEATTIGLGLRFALTFSGGTANSLEKLRFTNDGRRLTLHVDPSCAALVDSHTMRRFQQLVQSANLIPEIQGG
ncbi:MAG: hypothetical protein VYE33_02865 [Pseudomonadota bacterium]|nr:hypothetical protein [Pseudomonadota bacterium]